MKKIFAFVFLLATLLQACGAENATPAESDSTPKTAATVAESAAPAESTPPAASRLPVEESALKGTRVSVWHPWYGVEASLFDSLISDFNKKNPWGIAVSAESQNNFANLYESVNASLSTVEKPNLAIALPEQARIWHEQGAALDLTPFVEDPRYGMNFDDIPPVFWNQDADESARVGIPAQRDARLLLWNKTWAGELGFDTPPASAEDFRQQACRAQQSMLRDESPQNDAMGGWLVDTDPQTAYAWLLGFEGGVLEGSDYRFLTPNNIAAFTFARQLSEEGCAWEADTDPADAFAERKALFVTATLGSLPAVARALAAGGSRDQWQAASFPFENHALAVYGSSYVIFDSDAKKELAAWLFVRWLLQPEQDARLVEATHLFPLRAATLDELEDYARAHPQWRQAVNLIPQGVIQPQLSSWREVKTMLGDGFAHMYRVNLPSGQAPAILAQMESVSHELQK